MCFIPNIHVFDYWIFFYKAPKSHTNYTNCRTVTGSRGHDGEVGWQRPLQRLLLAVWTDEDREVRRRFLAVLLLLPVPRSRMWLRLRQSLREKWPGQVAVWSRAHGPENIACERHWCHVVNMTRSWVFSSQYFCLLRRNNTQIQKYTNTQHKFTRTH